MTIAGGRSRRTRSTPTASILRTSSCRLSAAKDAVGRLATHHRYHGVMVRAILFFGLASCGAAQSLISSSVVELPIEGIVSAIDAAGNTYIAGVTNTAGLPTTPGALQPNYGGGTCYSFGFFGGAQPFPCYSIFIAKLDPAGTRILSATYLGGKDRSSVGAIAIGDD